MFFKKKEDEEFKEKILDLTKNYNARNSRYANRTKAVEQGKQIPSTPYLRAQSQKGFLDLTQNKERENESPNLSQDLVFGGSNILEKKPEIDRQTNSNSTGFFGLFGSKTSQEETPVLTQTNSSTNDLETQEKRKKLAKRLMDITDKLEDLSNQIYHLQQRIELIEQKTRMI
jgi:hypothetical protein